MMPALLAGLQIGSEPMEFAPGNDTYRTQIVQFSGGLRGAHRGGGGLPGLGRRDDVQRAAPQASASGEDPEVPAL
jgi:hypothetical protein